jgi:hypothetical protein
VDVNANTILGILGAALPGVFVALVAQLLAQRREDQQARRVNANARMMVTLELAANRADLAGFWRRINELDAERRGEGTEAHLAAMAQNGLLGYTLPEPSLTQWTHLSAQAVGALSPEEVAKVYAFYADLRAVGPLYTQLVTIEPLERDEYAHGGSAQRFWYNYFAGRRVTLFVRLEQTVRRVLEGDAPLKA